MIDDDEIAERIAKHIRKEFGLDSFSDVAWFEADITGFLSDAEAYRLAFVSDVRERAAVRRQAKRVRAKVFRLLGLADRNEK